MSQAAGLPSKAPLGHHLCLQSARRSLWALTQPPTEPRDRSSRNAKLQPAAEPTAKGGISMRPGGPQKQGWTGRRGQSSCCLRVRLAAAASGHQSEHSFFLLCLRDWMWTAGSVQGHGLGSALTPETTFLCGTHGCGLGPRRLCLDAGKPEVAWSKAG